MYYIIRGIRNIEIVIKKKKKTILDVCEKRYKLMMVEYIFLIREVVDRGETTVRITMIGRVQTENYKKIFGSNPIIFDEFDEYVGVYIARIPKKKNISTIFGLLRVSNIITCLNYISVSG